MTHTHAIAAYIASNTPIGTRYTLVAVPGTELTDVCPFCRKPSHAKMCDEQRAMLDTPDMSVIGTAADYDQAEMLDYEQRRNTQLEEDCGTLRAELATAHELIGQSIAAMEAADAAMHGLANRLSDKGLYGYPCDMQGGQNPAAFQGLHAAIDAARAWLRKDATR